MGLGKMEESLKKISPYFNGLEAKKGLKGIEMKFPDGWEIRPNEKINYQVNIGDLSTLFYTIEEEISFDMMIDYIHTVIVHNQEREEKTKLKNEFVVSITNSFNKINEQINSLFLENDLETLRKIMKKNKSNFSKLDDFKIVTNIKNSLTKEEENEPNNK